MGTVVQFISPDSAQALTEIAHGPDKGKARFLKVFPKPQGLTRQKVVDAFNEAFEQIGGTSRLALWADSHPEEFFKLYARLLPPASHPDLDNNKEYVIRHILPPTALDAATAPSPPALPAPPETPEE